MKAEGVRQTLVLKFWLYEFCFEVLDFSQALPRSQGFHPGLQMLPLGLLFISGVPQLLRTLFDLGLSLSLIFMKPEFTN